MEAFTALVLAGRRDSSDALAGVWGTQHRALLDVNGVPMLLRVVRTLRNAKRVGRIVVSIDDPTALDAVDELRDLVAEGALLLHTSLASPSRSILDLLEGLPPGEKALAVTADHALLTCEMVEHFAAAADAGEADVCVALVAASLLRAHFPESKRTYLQFRDDGYSGANLFAFRTAQARRAVAFWRRAERFRKRPWRMVGSFGPITLALFLLHRLDLEAAFERISRAVGARVRAIRMPFPEAAIDVDRPADLALVSQILKGRAEAKQA
jgi:GTP:adenosylcobinamide-phosphate guanylyltransferase